MSLTKIGSIGINTGIQLAGVTTVSTLHVGSGVTLSSDGDGFFTGITSFTRNVTGDFAVRISNTHATGQGLNIRGGSANGQYALLVEDYAAANLFEINGDGEVEVKANHLRANHGVVVTGIVTATSFAGSGANLTGIDTDLVSDTSPQLGGNLDVNSKTINLGDSSGETVNRIRLGADNDGDLFHDGSDLLLREVDSGQILLRSDGAKVFANSSGSANQAIFRSGGNVELYHDGTKKLETTSGGVTVTGGLSATTGAFTGVVTLADGVANGLKVGDGQDLIIQHNGTNTFIDNNTGDLTLQTTGSGTDINIESLDDVFIKVHGSENAIRCIGDGAVELYNNNVKTFSTDANGIQVYGPEGEAAQILLYSDEGDDNADKWRIYNTGGNFLKWQTYASGSWQDAISAQSQNQVRLFYNGSEKLNTSNHGISLTGKIYMNNGNLQFGSAGNGIDFSATGDASGASSELLDDYEEGTWTARFYPNSSSFSSSSYDLDAAKYTKIGNVVYWAFRIRISSFSGGGGNIEISGLPYTVNSSQPMTTSSLHPSNWANNSPKNILYKNGLTRMDLYYESGTANSAAATNPVPLSSLQNNTYLVGQGFYFV